MKYFVTTTEGYVKAENANEAIEILNETENAIEVIKINESELPEDVRVEDAIYSCDCKTVIASK